MRIVALAALASISTPVSELRAETRLTVQKDRSSMFVAV
jgi:hypothetical protein